MIRFLHPPIAWRDLFRSTLRVLLLTTAAALMIAGKLFYVTGTRMQHIGEELR